MILAFDTATNVATIALVRNGKVLGDRPSRAVRILDDIDALLTEAHLGREDVDRVVVGTGPGSYTGLRIGLITARTLAFALGIPLAGVSTLVALAAGAPGSVPVIDGRRGEVFSFVAGEPAVLRPEELEVRSGGTYVGDGAVRYRDVLERAGAEIPPDESALHIPWARHHAALAADFGPADAVEPIYLRLPDAERALRA